MKTDLRRAEKNDIKKDFFKLKNMENVRKHRDIKIVTTEKRRNYLESEANYHTTKFFTENLLATKMGRTQILIKKSVCLGLSILDLSKTVMYEFWYDYVKEKYGGKAKLSYMDTNSFIFLVKMDDNYKDIAEDVETRLGTSNYRSLPKGKNKKVISVMKDELGKKLWKNLLD